MGEARPMRLRYTRPALDDLVSILDFIAERAPQGAGRVHARIQNIVRLLQDYPLAGAPTEHPAIQRMTTSPYPYLVFYEVMGDEIIIHAVRHRALVIRLNFRGSRRVGKAKACPPLFLIVPPTI